MGLLLGTLGISPAFHFSLSSHPVLDLKPKGDTPTLATQIPHSVRAMFCYCHETPAGAKGAVSMDLKPLAFPTTLLTLG